MGILSLYPRFINFLKLITFEKNIENLKYQFGSRFDKIESLYEEYLLNNPKGPNKIVFSFNDLDPESDILITGDVSTRGYFDLYLNEIENIHQLKFIAIYDGPSAHFHNTNYCDLSDLKAFQNLEVLYIDFEVINIDLLQLTYLENLKVLHLNKIHELDPKYSLPNVKSHLILLNEPAGSLEKAIPHVSNLNELSLICTKEEVIPPKIISSLTKLRRILLQATSINKIPKEIGKLKRLKHLLIRNNDNLTELPSEIGELQKLTKIELLNNPIISIPSEIGKLEKLQSLKIDNSSITELPSEICNLKNLETLILKGNKQSKLSSLPDSFGQLKNLRILNLGSNNLNCLPKNIGNLKLLEELNLSHNCIDTLPKSIGELKNLRKLDLRDTSLQTIPTEIAGLQNLETIYLDEEGTSALRNKLAFLLPACEIEISKYY